MSHIYVFQTEFDYKSPAQLWINFVPNEMTVLRELLIVVVLML